MRLLTKFLPLMLMAALFTQTGNTQAPAKPDAAPKPPDSPSKVLLANWNDNGRKLIAMAEDFPEDKYDFKPNPAQRSFAEQLLHAAGGNYYFINPAKGLKPPSGDPKRADYASKAAVVAFVKKSFAEGAELITSKGDAGLNDVYADPFSQGSQTRFSDGAWEFFEHSGEHYGQLVVYYRVAGLVPPESRPKK
jgi:DinB family protein